jgi:hypothetical protein
MNLSVEDFTIRRKFEARLLATIGADHTAQVGAAFPSQPAARSTNSILKQNPIT